MLHDTNGLTYVFAFWSVQAGTTNGVPIAPSIPGRDPSNFSVAVGADGNAIATAYFVWDFGSDRGANVVLIDAFDTLNGFFPDDFVNVNPDDGIPHTDQSSIYWKANDGMLVTEGRDADFSQSETLSAFNPLGRTFNYWLEIENLTYPTTNGPSVDGTDVNIMPHCRFVGFAVYSSLPPGKIWASFSVGEVPHHPGTVISVGGSEFTPNSRVTIQMEGIGGSFSAAVRPDGTFIWGKTVHLQLGIGDNVSVSAVDTAGVVGTCTGTVESWGP